MKNNPLVGASGQRCLNRSACLLGFTSACNVLPIDCLHDGGAHVH
jgi:hypothetical protein